jgi:hypothetical protein
LFVAGYGLGPMIWSPMYNTNRYICLLYLTAL